MADNRTPRPISPRDREILKDIIQAHVATGEPVSSRTVAKLERHGLSSASIRNIMADLEESGYLVQPHTSAGRVPTRAAYHLFIASLMEAQAPSARERRLIADSLKGATTDADAVTDAASHVLSELCQQATIVLTPRFSETRLKAIDFMPLSETRLLCVVVSSSGFVDTRVIDVEERVSREELVRISNYLTDNYAGLTLREIRDRLIRLLADERAQVDRLVARTAELAQKGLDLEQQPEVRVEGTAALLAQPELASVERVRRLFETFADRARLVQILNQCLSGGKGMRVFIGADTDVTSELDFSLVATTYGVGDRALGSIGVFGPSRMEYARVIPLVQHLGDTLSEALSSFTVDG